MAKYDPLQRYLRRQKTAVVELTFSEIERLIGALLPKRSALAQWWANESENARDVQVEAWRQVGFKACLKSDDRVRFERD